MIATDIAIMEAFWGQQDVNARHSTEENVVNKVSLEFLCLRRNW